MENWRNELYHYGICGISDCKSDEPPVPWQRRACCTYREDLSILQEQDSTGSNPLSTLYKHA